MEKFASSSSLLCALVLAGLVSATVACSKDAAPVEASSRTITGTVALSTYKLDNPVMIATDGTTQFISWVYKDGSFKVTVRAGASYRLLLANSLPDGSYDVVSRVPWTDEANPPAWAVVHGAADAIDLGTVRADSTASAGVKTLDDKGGTPVASSSSSSSGDSRTDDTSDKSGQKRECDRDDDKGEHRECDDDHGSKGDGGVKTQSDDGQRGGESHDRRNCESHEAKICSHHERHAEVRSICVGHGVKVVGVDRDDRDEKTENEREDRVGKKDCGDGGNTSTSSSSSSGAVPPPAGDPASPPPPAPAPSPLGGTLTADGGACATNADCVSNACFASVCGLPAPTVLK